MVSCERLQDLCDALIGHEQGAEIRDIVQIDEDNMMLCFGLTRTTPSHWISYEREGRVIDTDLILLFQGSPELITLETSGAELATDAASCDPIIEPGGFCVHPLRIKEALNTWGFNDYNHLLEARLRQGARRYSAVVCDSELMLLSADRLLLSTEQGLHELTYLASLVDSWWQYCAEYRMRRGTAHAFAYDQLCESLEEGFL